MPMKATNHQNAPMEEEGNDNGSDAEKKDVSYDNPFGVIAC